jgi:hypothetical protein
MLQTNSLRSALLQSKKQSSAISDDDDDSDVRPSKLFQRPNRTPSGLGDELSGLGTRDKKAAYGKHRVLNSSESDSDEADGSMKTPDCGIDELLQLAMGQIRECIFQHKPCKSKRFHILAVFPPKGSRADKEHENQTSRELYAVVGNFGFLWNDLFPYAPVRNPRCCWRR